MPDHDKKILADLEAHIEKKTGKPTPGKTQSPVQTADLRDSISLLVGGGYTALSDEDSKANFGRISKIVGEQKAQQLLTHIFLQNQRPEFKTMKPEQRVSGFYDINSSNQPVDEVLQSVKAFGTGPQAGYTDSINLINQKQQGNAADAGIAGKIAKQ